MAYATVAVSHSDFRRCRPETNDLKADIIAVRFSAAFFERQIHSVAELNGISLSGRFSFLSDEQPSCWLLASSNRSEAAFAAS
ncbi:hypothetical protein [Paraburkholderia terricola]|uniref:hypothetical protein n=1 Tax=Paraburkholderia terricola TaxID=169427 RepID=UPI002860F840|nr:hypothetical protein [Paraburkholderia terricola]MDR6484873.1 hypothetical protein [Paraburkholderia terricola]